MTNLQRGDIVLVRFIFSDETGIKLRPALIISSEIYHHKRQEVIVAAITSNIGRILVGDYLLKDWESAGLVAPSVLTGIIRTIKRTMIERRLGHLANRDLEAADRQLRKILYLS